MSLRNRKPWQESPEMRAERVAIERDTLPRAKSWSKHGDKINHSKRRKSDKIKLKRGDFEQE